MWRSKKNMAAGRILLVPTVAAKRREGAAILAWQAGSARRLPLVRKNGRV
jgi:hypothetical protein